VFVRKSDALKAAIEEERRIPRGMWTDPALARVPFREWAAYHRGTTLHQRTSTRARDESYLRVHLLPAFGDMPLGAIEPIDVQKFVAKLANRRAPATVVLAYQLLARIMAAAVDSGYISRSPCRGVKLPRVERVEMRFLSAPQLEELAEAVPPSYRALVLTTGYTGLRWGEVAGLKRERLNLLKGTLEVAEVLTEVRGALAFGDPKTKSSRRVLTVPRFLADELQGHLENHSTHPELVFAGPEGGSLRRNNFRRRVGLPALAQVGLEGLRFHDLRHTAAGILIAQNVHPKVIQSRLGHSSIRVTFDTYGQLLPRLDEEVADGLEATHQAAQIGRSSAHTVHGVTD
jgi:integrase